MISTYIIGLIFIVSVWAFQNGNVKSNLLFAPYIIQTKNQHWRWITHVFVHANWPHLLVNLWVFYTFVGRVEGVFSQSFHFPEISFLIFIVASAVASSLSDFVKNRNNPHYASLGASGVVSAVLFMFIVYFPTSPLQFIILPGVNIPAFVIGILYLLYEYQMRRKNDGIAHDAHIFGALFGIVAPLAFEPSIYLNSFQSVSIWIQSIFS